LQSGWNVGDASPATRKAVFENDATFCLEMCRRVFGLIKIMKTSVIICTFNRNERLTEALESLMRMSVPLAMEWEVLIVDNNSTDATKSTGESFAARYAGRIRYIFEGAQGKSFALNTGIREAHGDFLAFTDDDVTFDQHWLTELVGTLEKFNCAGVGGKIIPVWNFSKPRWFQESDSSKLFPAIVSFDMGEKPCSIKTAAFGANMAFRKELFLKYGGFRADLGPTVGSEIRGEDSEFCRRLIKAGQRVVYAPTAVVYHPVEKRRAEKSYFEAWYLGRGRASVREGGIPENAIRYFGVPRYLLALLFRSAVKWLCSANSKNRFHYKLEVYETIGQIQESRTRGPAHP
jgi:glucosyl-dolichyl phosphate glucuronosyltransferase